MKLIKHPGNPVKTILLYPGTWIASGLSIVTHFIYINYFSPGLLPHILAFLRDFLILGTWVLFLSRELSNQDIFFRLSRKQQKAALELLLKGCGEELRRPALYSLDLANSLAEELQYEPFSRKMGGLVCSLFDLLEREYFFLNHHKGEAYPRSAREGVKEILRGLQTLSGSLLSLTDDDRKHEEALGTLDRLGQKLEELHPGLSGFSADKPPRYFTSHRRSQPSLPSQRMGSDSGDSGFNRR